MFEAWANLLTRRAVAWAVVVITAIVLVVCGALSTTITQDDDVLAFLPDTNPDIRAFRAINENFGSTDVALIGIPAENPFDPAFLETLTALTRELRDTPGVASVLSLTNVADFLEDPETGGIINDELVDAIPETQAEQAALRAKVMSRDHVVGTLISEEADAVLVYAFGISGKQPREIAEPVRETVLRHFPDTPIYWGGAPFISTWIYEATQADMLKLTPWAVVAIIGIMLLAFRDLVGSVLGLTATLVGIMVTRAVIALTGVSFNIVLSSMPVILFALGSAYAIHILSHVNRHARDVGPGAEAVRRTLIGTGPTVLTAGLTVVCGLASFVTMDIVPMQTFGAFTALGIGVALIASLTFVPAVLVLFPRPVHNRKNRGALLPLMRKLVAAARGPRRAVVGVSLLCVFAGGLLFAGRVDTRMDLRAFFDEGTEPDLAQHFLDQKFGGSQYVQIDVKAPLEDPGVLREIGRVSDALRAIPLVSDVSGIDGVLELVSEAMAGSKRIPDTTAQVATIYRFASSDPSTSRLVTQDRGEGLIQVRLGTDDSDELGVLLEQVRDLIDHSALHGYKTVTRNAEPEATQQALQALLLPRLRALSRLHHVALPDDVSARLDAWFVQEHAKPDLDVIASQVSAFLGSEESFVNPEPAQAEAIGHAVAGLAPDVDDTTLATAVADALGLPVDDSLVGDVVMAVAVPLQDAQRAARAQARVADLIGSLGLSLPEDGHASRFKRDLGGMISNLEAPDAIVASEAADAPQISWTVSGMPVLYQGLSRSVTANQFKSLGSALVLVFIIMTVLYRSVTAGLLAATPTMFTLAVVYGAMGLMGVHLDIGTSMLASIVLGTGVDYAIHMLARWESADGNLEHAASRAVETTSHAIWTNAIMVAAGFFVLTLGDARPLKNVGGLTATAMIVAAFSTFVVIPLLARRDHYGHASEL